MLLKVMISLELLHAKCLQNEALWYRRRRVLHYKT